MPILTWPGKKISKPSPANLSTYAFIYPSDSGSKDQDPKNRIIYGDNLEIMAALKVDYMGKIDLIYTDPPFFTNKKYSARIGQGEDSRRPKDWQLAEGYPDDWVDIDEYLNMLYPRLVLMHQLLSDHGTLYLHLDWHANHYARLLLDEIFGPDRLLNEIVWAYHGPSPIRTAFNRKHDTILAYTKSETYTFNADAVREPYHPNTIKTFKSSPKAGFGKVPNLKQGKVPEDWWYFPVVARLHSERTGYPTQKPEALVERIIQASSNPGDLVADFFCGSGTTPVVAGKLGRRYIGSDIMWRAIQTTQIRLVQNQADPFYIEFATNTPIPFSQNFIAEVAFHPDEGFQLTCEEIDKVIYWDVDPNWDGKIFRSSIHAARPRNRGSVSLTLPADIDSESQNMRARVITSDGNTFEFPVIKKTP